MQSLYLVLMIVVIQETSELNPDILKYNDWIKDAETTVKKIKAIQKKRVEFEIKKDIYTHNKRETDADSIQSYKLIEMEREKIVPDVIAVAPKSVMKITYNNLFVQLGNEFTSMQVKSQPRVHWESEPGAFYTLSMTDPDVPSRANPAFREVLHWLVGNIPGAASKIHMLDLTKGDVLAEFIGSGPPNGTGLHRYVFLAYKQPEKLTFDEARISARSREGRRNFRISKFAEKYKLGNPIVGNFYVAQYDKWVPQFQKQFEQENKQ